MSEVIGIMEGAFFVSRGDLMQWVNDTFQLNITKIEQFGAGNIYCQILDAIAPGKINMARVNWRAHLEWEFINNLKLLQQGFVKCGLNKHIDIEKLSKAKYQDNLEFAQWMKRYYDLNNGSTKDYDPVARRGNIIPDFGFGDKQPTNRGGKNNEDNRGLRIDKKDRMRSMGPVMRQGDRKKTDLLLPKKKVGSKEAGEEIKGLYEYLMNMKNITETDTIPENEKIEKISELVKESLSLKMFDAERKNKRQHRGTIDQIIEDATESM